MRNLIIPFLFLSSVASAESYLMAGGGLATHQLNGDGVWFQQSFDHSIKSTSPAWFIGGGIKLTSWLAIEGAYHDFGKTSISGDFVFPDSNYKPENANHCDGPCNPMVHGEGQGKATGWSLSLVPSVGITRDWYVYAKLGIIWYKRKWEERVKCCAEGPSTGAYGPQLNATPWLESFHPVGNGWYRWSGDGNLSGPQPNSSGSAMIGSLGIGYRHWRMEWLKTKGVVAAGSGFTGIGTWSVSYLLKF